MTYDGRPITTCKCMPPGCARGGQAAAANGILLFLALVLQLPGASRRLSRQMSWVIVVLMPQRSSSLALYANVSSVLNITWSSAW